MEIYIEYAPLEIITKWFSKHYKVNGLAVDAGDAKVLEIEINKNIIPVIITTGIEETEFTGIFFNSDNLPWPNYEDLAAFAATEFKSKIRYEKQDVSPVFYELFNGSVSEITWE